MKALIAGMLAMTCALSMTACSSRKDNNSSSSSSSIASSSAPSSSAPLTSSVSEPSVSSAPSSSGSSMASGSSASSHKEGVVSDVEDAVDHAVSDVASLAAPTMSTDFSKIGTLATSQVPWGPGVQVDEENRTTASDSLQEQYGKYGAYFIAPRGCGKFYLTFDEGYENGYTPAILDVLKEKGVSAVFFVTAPFVKTCPDLIQRMIDEGHVVGNHTNHHWNPTQKSLDDAAQDIKDLHDYMLENFNYTMSLYRPPEGAFSEQTLAMAQELGYTTVLWSFAYADWDPNNQVGYQTALEKTEKFIHEGAIYLLHAVSKDNAEILGQLIDDIRAKGLELSKWDLPYVSPAES
ncbi:MAG: polysaccharide deacetylase family protein [Oscillospiraceae bacterium]|nr:polysaccharide deacetylase family protein [Oscillospiraceae bacterium]